MQKIIPIFIGYDKKESVAYHVLTQSILRQSSVPVSFIPISLDILRQNHLYWRETDPNQSNEFSFSRFLVPQIAHNMGLRACIFMDLDMLFRCDIAELWDLRRLDKAVQVVKHDYTPKDQVKYLGNVQHAYPRKNWSSLMIFNLAHFHLCGPEGPRKLKPQYVNTASGLELHRFMWIEDDYIGELPTAYNWLVGEYDFNPKAKVVHFTVGGPYFTEYRDCDYADEWREEFQRCVHADQLQNPAFEVVHGKVHKDRPAIMP